MINYKAMSLINLNLLDSALVFANQAKHSFIDIEDNYFTSQINQRIGSIHFKKKKYTTALAFYKASESIENQHLFSSANHNEKQKIGDIYLALNEYGLAEKYYTNFLQSIQSSDDKLLCFLPIEVLLN